MTDIITLEGIKQLLNNESFPIYVFKELDSTNTFAKALADDCALVIAESQSAGRGRMGRSFFSPEGSGAYFSIKLQVPDLYQNVPFITTLASVAVHKAAKELYNKTCGIKWVNDVYLDNKKVSGILCESPDPSHVIIGIGINVYPSAFPKELEGIATCLTDTVTSVSRGDLIAHIAKSIISMTNSLPDTSFMEYYKAHSIVIGKPVTFIMNGTAGSGIATDITNEGALKVETPNGIVTLSTGEITLRFTD